MNEDMDTEDVTLPELSDARIDEIEGVLFRAIGRERQRDVAAQERARRARRGRLWLGTGGAAAVIVIAAVLAPSMPAIIGGMGGGSDASTAEGAPDIAPADGGDLGGAVDQGGNGTMSGEGASEESGTAREIIATASATVRVADAEAAATRIGELATGAGGYVEAMSVGGERAVPYDDMVDGGMVDDGMGGDAVTTPSPSSAWITVRVPAAELADVTAALSDVGEVTASQIDRRDVTSEAIDLRARVEALEASVARLTDLVGEAESTADLIAAEDALATRQSDLEAYQQQLKYLDEQVGMSTLTVSLFEPSPVVTADPAGFGDGIAAGWGGLVATLNGLVIALGFLLPWLAVIAVAATIVWGVRRVIRRRRTAAAAAGTPDSDAPPAG
ncbi:DUF4349 domain-containing protein [Microbacterium sp. T2.11-28]|uniref:DUF4349 domain-containing protein n=1 Tax=Microbacterium sp. T2.11-28 TaxID=3041169 RepID=UPI002477616D|nr:DUF4349 domain-containing protein [Microbacterium sp. T2.11-28]CAI9386407.1 hypothetical protein MICABA_00380 [Microbacterium sp. T2.11-28]